MDFVVAIVGRPNVGKSALFNRITGTGSSIVHKQSGVTRDRLYARCEWQGHEFTLLDTGGFDLSSSSELAMAIRAQIEQAIEEADLLIFVVDARTGVLPEDLEVAEILRRTNRPVLVSPNKCDAPGHDHKGFEFYTLGFPEVFPISAAHGLGIGDLLDRITGAKEQGCLLYTSIRMPARRRLCCFPVFFREPFMTWAMESLLWLSINAEKPGTAYSKK